MALMIIFLVLFAICAGVSIYLSVRLVRTPMIEVDYRKQFLKTGLFIGGAIVSFIVASFGLYLHSHYNADFWHVFQLIVGAIFFVAALLIGVNGFIIHYYGRSIPEKLDKWLFRTLIISLVAGVVFFFVYTNGIAPCFTYPLINGVSFSDGLVRPNHDGEDGTKITPNIAWYALCILSGAILVYFICDHYMYKEYGRHGILESTFFVAFPAGIIGGRIGYVIGNWHEFAGEPFWHVFAIWKGGLTILAGAPIGIIVGALWFKWRNKGMSLRLAADLVVPTILIAQAIGRWGNFFNCEVSGYPSSVENWKWLPEIIWRNAQFDDYGYQLAAGQLYVPLFFIEAAVNLLGYFVLAHVFGKALRKYTELGDLAYGYVIWYGLTRVFMEPLRSSSYKMGSEGSWSWIWAMVFTVLGTLLIVINHLVNYLLEKKKGEYHVKKNDKIVGLVSGGLLLVSGLLLFIFGLMSIVNNQQYKSMVNYNGYTIGWMMLVVGISLLVCLVISVTKVLEGFKKRPLANE